MKILPVFSHNINIKSNYKNNSAAHVTQNTVSGEFDLESQSSILNRSLVNFKAAMPENDPYKKDRDKIFLHNVSVSLRLTREQKEKFVQLTEKYLKDENLESLYQISDEDNFNYQAHYVSTMEDALDLSSKDCVVLSAEFCDLYEEQHYDLKEVDYFKDRSLAEKIFTENGISENLGDTLFGLLEGLAFKHKLPDIFSVMDKKRCPEGIEKLSDYLSVIGHCSEDQKDDILISFAKVNITPQQEREDPDMTDDKYYVFDSDWTNQVYAEVIQNELNLPKDSVNEIKKIVAEYINPLKDPGEDFVPNVKAGAYYIADKFDLNAQQQSKIVRLLEGAMNNTV